MAEFICTDSDIEIDGDCVDVIVEAFYVPKTVCNEHNGHCEYEGHNLEDMKVLFRGKRDYIDITEMLQVTDALGNLERKILFKISKGEING
jgi:hypothetical protein